MPALLFALIGNRFAQLGLALFLGYAYGWWTTSSNWKEYVAKERAEAEYVRQVERVRQEAAAREIASEATRRLEEEQALTAEMQKQLDDLKRSESNVPQKDCPSCRIDSDFARRMRQLDATGRKASAPRRSR